MSESTTQPTTQIKLLVNTASEAVSVIRERYGESARVLSVKQVEAEGLKRLISKPRLEVIVEVVNPKAKEPSRAKPRKEEAAPAKPKAKEAAPAADTPPRAAPEASEAPDAAPAPKTPIGNLYAKQKGVSSGGYFSQFEDKAQETSDPSAESREASEETPAPIGSAANPVRRGTKEAVQRAVSMLEAVGFDRSLIERIRSEVNFKDIGSLPTMELYAKICDWLRGRFPASGKPRLASRRAFIGCSGVGKTSALSKMLSSEVFINGLAPTVLKVDGDLPNASDGLEVFCEIMGADLARSIEEVEQVSAERPLLVDMPGYSLARRDSIEGCRATLDDLEVEERILVINAAYEAELIAEMMAAGESVGASWVVFTHLEETRRAGKLWKLLLNGRIKPLFFSDGPNPAGEYVMETYSYLLERTFPNGRELAAAARRDGSGARPAAMREASFRS